jgi:hypothetical protein
MRGRRAFFLFFLSFFISQVIANLHDAAKHGDAEAAARLIEEGADVNGRVRGRRSVTSREAKRRRGAAMGAASRVLMLKLRRVER